jgi:pimeloyl-ACP methyl ester carboxylesterase
MDTYESAKTLHIEVNGTSIAYRIIGPKSEYPLLCLQHFTGSMDGWDPAVINGLSRNRQIILFDNKGVGESEGITPDTVAEMTKDTLAFLDAMQLQKVDLLGFSLGGFISQLLMAENAHRVRKAILAGTCQQGGKGTGTFRHFVQAVGDLDGADRYFYFFFEDSARSRSLGYALLKRFHLRDPNWAPAYKPQVTAAHIKAIEGWNTVPDPEHPLLKKIQHPVLIVMGSNDHMFASTNAYTMFQQLDTAILSFYPDAAHGALFQYPDLFSHQANYFLDSSL